jgi:hypothetical protein
MFQLLMMSEKWMDNTTQAEIDKILGVLFLPAHSYYAIPVKSQNKKLGTGLQTSAQHLQNSYTASYGLFSEPMVSGVIILLLDMFPHSVQT